MVKPDRLEHARYILSIYFSESGEKLSETQLWKLISTRATYLYGIKGALEMGLYLSYSSKQIPFVIYRVSHEKIKEFFMILASISSDLDGNRIKFVSKQISGTLLDLKEEESKYLHSDILKSRK